MECLHLHLENKDAFIIDGKFLVECTYLSCITKIVISIR